MTNPATCLNCGETLAGRWCHACGQKRLEPRDRTLRSLLGEFFGAITNLDGRVTRSFLYLLFRPARLAADYLGGIRVRYLSPITLFLAINVVYFFAPTLTDFNLPLDNHMHGNLHSALVRPLVEARLAERGIELAAYADLFNAELLNLAKLLILLHVPLIALGLALLHPRRHRPFADHVLTGFWLMAFILTHLQLTPLLLALLLGILGVSGIPGWLLDVALLGPLVAWISFLLRGAYGQPLWLAALKMPLTILAAMFAHLVYRAVLFFVTFART
ncbi:MAG TPA: DUF3667 domain-containing protein [Gammaproteobacteria bacterium]